MLYCKCFRVAGPIIAALIFLYCGGLAAQHHRPMADFNLQAVPGRILSESGIRVHAGKRGLIRDGAFHSDGSRESFLAVWEKEMRESAPGFDGRELSGAFRIAFDTGAFGSEKNSRFAPFGMFACRLTPENKLELVFRTRPDDPLGPEFTICSASRIEFGKYNDIAFSYSVNMRRVRLYLNGKFEAEATPDFLPELDVRTVDFGRGFRGRLAFLRLYDGVLNADELTVRAVSEAERKALCARLEKIIARHGNPHLTFWCETLIQYINGRAAAFGFTRAGWDYLTHQTENAETMARLLAENGGRGRISDRIVTVFSVPATGGELLGPYDLPKDGLHTDTLRITAAKDEFESFSFLVFPFGKIRKFELVIADLTAKNGARIPASAIDARLVKRLFRSGGAWTGGTRDPRGRVLVPDLLLHDENLLRVNETKRSVELRFSYPDGARYVDVSRVPGSFGSNGFDIENQPVFDAETLRSVRLEEPGRTQRFLLTVHVPESAAEGIYTGEVKLLADGRDAGSLTLKLRVLPFALPSVDSEKIFFCAAELASRGEQARLNGDPDRLKRLWAGMAAYGFRLSGATAEPVKTVRADDGSENPARYRKMLFHAAEQGNAGMIFPAFYSSGWNDFATRRGSPALLTRNGAVYTLAAEGLREGMDDLRYAALLLRLEREAGGKNAPPRPENAVSGDYDPDCARLDMIERILELRRQPAEEGNKK